MFVGLRDAALIITIQLIPPDGCRRLLYLAPQLTGRAHLAIHVSQEEQQVMQQVMLSPPALSSYPILVADGTKQLTGLSAIFVKKLILYFCLYIISVLQTISKYLHSLALFM